MGERQKAAQGKSITHTNQESNRNPLLDTSPEETSLFPDPATLRFDKSVTNPIACELK